MAKQPKQLNEFTKHVTTALDFLRNDVIAKYLKPHSTAPALYELFVFSDLPAIRMHIMGAPRATLHTALNNPRSYLQCSCCALANVTQMLPTLPDLSIVYKLHLESGQMINLFDWMQVRQSNLFKSLIIRFLNDFCIAGFQIYCFGRY